MKKLLNCIDHEKTKAKEDSKMECQEGLKVRWNKKLLPEGHFQSAETDSNLKLKLGSDLVIELEHNEADRQWTNRG